MPERLQKLMARAGIGSRRHCEELITADRVTVNDYVAKLGDRADPVNDKIRVDGQILQYDELIYIKLNKPKGVLSSTEDELNRNRPTIRDIVGIPGHIYPVGRLDKQSEGLILLTNDGQLTHYMTHPRFGHQKVYRVLVSGRPSPTTLKKWRHGLLFEGRLTAPVEIEEVKSDSDQVWLRITMREGRKRQIRRIAASLGHPVVRLIREQIGPVNLEKLDTGEWQFLSADEIDALRKAAFSGKK